MIIRNNKWPWLAVVFFLGLSVSTAQARHGEGDPIRGGGPFGVGVEFGYPGDWGVVGKLWLSYVDALQPDVKFAGSEIILQLDYLWHNYHLFHVHSGSLPIYIGLGGDLSLTDPAAFGVRVPFGLSYIFGRQVPLDIYAQVVPTLWITTRDSAFHLYGNVGIRLYP
jgi:hypothetical protein